MNGISQENIEAAKKINDRMEKLDGALKLARGALDTIGERNKKLEAKLKKAEEKIVLMKLERRDLRKERDTLNENLRKLGQNELADYIQSTETITELADALREILRAYENILQNEWSTTSDPDPAKEDDDCVRARKALARLPAKTEVD